MPKIVILGSCRFEPYTFLAVPNKIPGLWNTEEGYKKAAEKFYPAMDQADEVWIYAPDGVGEHTQRDIDYALSIGKEVKVLVLYQKKVRDPQDWDKDDYPAPKELSLNNQKPTNNVK
jgi:hypothetical protein